MSPTVYELLTPEQRSLAHLLGSADRQRKVQRLARHNPERAVSYCLAHGLTLETSTELVGILMPDERPNKRRVQR